MPKRETECRADERQQAEEHLMKLLGYSFHDRDLLRLALTHRSYAYEKKLERQNERLEFLGDALLQLLVSQLLFHMQKQWSEGELTKVRALCVREESLAALAARLDLGAALRLGRGEAMSGGAERPSLLADACEALMAAVYLDLTRSSSVGEPAMTDFSALTQLASVFWPHFSPIVQAASEGAIVYNYKSALLEWIQKGADSADVEFRELAKTGPDHAPMFQMGVYFKKRFLASAEASSKKEAEQAASREALELLKKESLL